LGKCLGLDPCPKGLINSLSFNKGIATFACTYQLRGGGLGGIDAVAGHDIRRIPLWMRD